jgi:hypothetical protein
MKYNLGKRYLFLPINEVIIKEYNGYIYKGQLMPELKETDVKETIKDTDINFHPIGIQKVIMGFFMIVIILTSIPFLLLWVYINEKAANSAIDKIEILAAKLAFVKGEISVNYSTVYKKEFANGLHWEKIPESLSKISESNYHLAFYTFDSLPAEVLRTIKIINERYNLNCQLLVDKKSIKNFIDSNVNIRNSKVLVEDKNDIRFWNELNFNDVNPTTSRDQNIILWDRYSTNNFFQSTKIKEYFTLENIVYREVSKGYLARSDVYTNPSDVFFIGHDGDENVRKFILDNYENLNKRFAEKGYNLNLLLIDIKNNTADSLLHKINKFIPWTTINIDLVHQIEKLLKNQIVKEQDFENDFLAFLGLPDLNNACFIRYIDLFHSEYNRSFLAFNLFGTNEEIQTKIDFYLDNIDNHFEGYPAYSMYKGPYDADLFFNYRFEQQIPNEEELIEAGDDRELLLMIHNTIESVKQQNKSGLIIGLFREIATNIKDTNPELANDLINVLNKHTATPKLSRLLITKDYRILLTDYNNLEIPMYPLAKIVFLLFINHPEGILFKNMIDYRKELEGLYMKVTGRVITPKIKNSLNDITDASCNSIAQKVARIRSSFKAYLPEQIADYYSIKGENAEPKLIAINRELVDWERKK